MSRVSRIAYLIASWLFLAGVTAQVFLAGMVVVAGQTGWASHRDLGHAMGLPLLVMVITAYLARCRALRSAGNHEAPDLAAFCSLHHPGRRGHPHAGLSPYHLCFNFIPC